MAKIRKEKLVGVVASLPSFCDDDYNLLLDRQRKHIRWLIDHPEITKNVNLREFMSGNLCRCTGYDGVIDGLERVLKQQGVTPDAR